MSSKEAHESRQPFANKHDPAPDEFSDEFAHRVETVAEVIVPYKKAFRRTRREPIVVRHRRLGSSHLDGKFMFWTMVRAERAIQRTTRTPSPAT